MNYSNNTTIEWRVANLDCENEAAKIRSSLKLIEGIKNLIIYPNAAKISIIK